MFLPVTVLAVVLQLQPSIFQAVSQVLAASLQGYTAQLTSDTITLGGSEPDLSTLAQAAKNLNVTLHDAVRVPCSGKDKLFSIEWHDYQEDNSRVVEQVLAVLQKHVCSDESQAVSVASQDIFNKGSYASHFSAKRVKLSATKTDCLIVDKLAAAEAVLNPMSVYDQVCFSSHTRYADGCVCLLSVCPVVVQNNLKAMSGLQVFPMACK